MLQQLKLFEGLSSIDQARYLGKMEKKKIPKGSIIFKKDEPGEWMYILVKGVIDIIAESHQGDAQTISVIHAGETFGEMALLTGELRSTNAKAASDVELYILHREVFDELISQYASVANYFTRLLCERLVQNNDQLLQMKNEQLKFSLDFLNSIPDDLKQILLLSSYLTEIDLDFLESFFDDPELKLKLFEISLHTQLFTIKEEQNQLCFHQASLPSVNMIANKEMDPDVLGKFLFAAADDYKSRDSFHEAISLYAKYGYWNQALSYFEENIDMLKIPSEDHMNLVNLLDQCPEEMLFAAANFEVTKLYLKYKVNLHPALGFSRLEQAIHHYEHQYDDREKTVLYEFMAEFCFELGFKQKALDYLNLAHRFVNPDQPNTGIFHNQNEDSDKQELYAIAKQNYYQMKNADRIRDSQLIFNRNKIIKASVFATGIGILILFALMIPFAGLSREAMLFIGITFMAILFWMTNVMADYLVSLLMSMGWVLLGITTPEIALSGFSSTIWLFIVFVLILGAAIMYSGIMYRVSLFLLKIFPKTYRGQLMGLALTSVMINPLIPSGMTKSMLSTPIAVNLSESLGFKDRSRGAAGMVLTTFLLFVYVNPFFMTAGVSNFLALGLISGYEISFLSWSWYAFPALCVYIMAVLFFAFYVYKPEQVNHRLSDQLIKEQLSLLGKLKKNEIILLVVLASVILLLLFQSMHGISGVWILLIGLTVLIISKSLERSMIKKTVDFTSLLHIGVALGFAQVAADVGADLWFSERLLYIISPFTHSPYIFLPALAVLIFMICFFVDAIPATILLIVSLLPLFQQMNYDPWVLIFVVLLTTGPFFLPYQSEIYLATYYATEEKSFTHKQGRHFSLWYAFVVLLIIICSIPFWKLINLI